jgi:hypothetical protein
VNFESFRLLYATLTRYRDLAGVFDEVKTARVGDPAERAKVLEADDFFEGNIRKNNHTITLFQIS